MVKRRSAVTLMSLAVAVLLAGCGKGNNDKKEAPSEEKQTSIVKLTPRAAKEIGLETEAIVRKPFARWIVVPAKVLANQDNEAQVGSLVQGRVCKVFVKIGDYVQTGQELMLVEGLAIGEVKAGFLSARANLVYRKSNCERQKKLLEENVGSQKSYLESQNEYEKALAEYGCEKNRINAIGLDDSAVVDGRDSRAGDRSFGTLPVRSPISGIVVERNVVIGQLIEGTTNAFRIVNLRSVWVDGQVYEKDIDKIKNGAPANFAASPFPDESFAGTVSYVGQVVDEKTRTITIRAEFDNKGGKLKPQMFGDLKIPCPKPAAALLVPAEALVRMDNGDFVFVKKEAFVFELRPVTIGAVQNECAEIKDGIREGEKTVVKGAFYLKAELQKAALGEGE
jgi:membrane fusion protein, heavy metal efflux system